MVAEEKSWVRSQVVRAGARGHGVLVFIYCNSHGRWVNSQRPVGRDSSVGIYKKILRLLPLNLVLLYRVHLKVLKITDPGVISIQRHLTRSQYQE